MLQIVPLHPGGGSTFVLELRLDVASVTEPEPSRLERVASAVGQLKGADDAAGTGGVGGMLQGMPGKLGGGGGGGGELERDIRSRRPSKQASRWGPCTR
jgi:hypothetical protein